MTFSRDGVGVPLVSVVVPTYDRRRVLQRAVESVLTQTHADLECIVVDDGSTDGTREYLRSVSDSRLRVIRRDRPFGISSARNAGVAVASGDYVVFLDDDDRLFEDAVATLVETIRGRPASCGMVYTAREDVWETGGRSERRVDEGCIRTYEATPNIGGPSCTLVRAEVFDEVGGFDESFPAREDVEFWIRLLAVFSTFGVDQALYERHHHSDQLSENAMAMLQGQRRLLDKHGHNLSSTARSSEYVLMAHAHAHLGDSREARSKLRTAIRSDPGNWTAYWLYCALTPGTFGYRCGREGARILRCVSESLGR